MKVVFLVTFLGGLLMSPPSLRLPQGEAVPFWQDVRQEGHAEAATVEARDMRLWRKAKAAVNRAYVLRRQSASRSLRATLPLLQQAARLYNVGRASERASDVYLDIGETDSTLGDYDKALVAYEEALHLAGDDLTRSCRARSRMAGAYAFLGRSSSADSSVHEIDDFCKSVTETHTLAEMSLARGQVSYYSGDLTRSREHLQSAQKYFAQVGYRDGEADALLLLAEATFEHDQTAAVNFAEDALRLWTSPLNKLGVAKARKVLGVFAATRGQFEAASCNSSTALEIFHNMGDKAHEATVLNALGKVARESGDLQTSLWRYRQARVIFAGIQDRLGEAIAISGIGAALTLMHQYRTVRQLYKEELQVAEQAKNPLFVAFALMDLADVDRLQHLYKNSEALYRGSLVVYESLDHRSGEGDALIRLAYLLAEQNKDAEALPLLDRARSLKAGTGQLEDVAAVDYETAFLYRHMGRLEDARAAIERTINVIESQRLQIATFDSRAAYFAAVHRYYSLYIEVLMALHKQQPESGFAQRAFEASERSKVRSLLDLLTISNQNSPCDELRNRSLNPQPGGENRPNAVETEISQVLSLKKIQAEIQDDDTVILEYALGDDGSYLWAVDRKHIAAYELPPSVHLGTAARSFLDGLMPLPPRQGETASAYDARARALRQASALHAKEISRLLLGQISLPPEKRVLIVPDGFLQYIPFSALPLPAAGENNAVLLTHHEVVVLPSASALAALRTAAANRQPPNAGIVILADPVFQRAQRKSGSPAGSAASRVRSVSPALTRAARDITGSPDLEPLPGSREEALAIRKIFYRDASVIVGYQANRRAVLQGLLAGYRVIHLATHGMIDVLHPEMSGIVLSLFDQQGRPQDGYLRLGDIYNLKLSADLVVLSSCESALGKELQSEGIIGLPRGFLHAGARTVIASLWKVDDDATAFLMARFYKRIRQRYTVAAALRAAQLEMAGNRRFSQSNPWAAFVLLGDYQYSIEFKTAL